MSCLLLIESSTEICSVAVSLNDEVVWSCENSDFRSHSSVLGVFVSKAVDFIKVNNLKLNAVAISGGPGSYTGLRIGTSVAKGLCFGCDIPLIAIPTLKIMASALLPSSSYLCPMIDARRMEVYMALFDGNLNEMESVKSIVVDENFYSEILTQNEIVFFGNGVKKCKSIIKSSNAIFVNDIYPSASNMVGLAKKALSCNDLVDCAYFEPFYFKEFQTTIPKNKVINAEK